MKLLTNESLQTLEVFLLTNEGVKAYLLQPKENVVVPPSFISQNILKLQKRRLLSVKNYS